MLGPTLAKITAGFILAGTARTSCNQMKENIDISVVFDQRAPVVSTALSGKELLAKFGKTSDSTLSGHGKLVTNSGLVSRVTSGMDVYYTILLDKRAAIGCFVVKDVKYAIRYYPEIYISSDIKNLGCHYSAALLHEKQHVNADLRAINDYIPKLKAKLKEAAEAVGPRGPFLREQIVPEKESTKRTIEAAIKPLYDEMIERRRAKQAEIDAPGNYGRDASTCSSQPLNFQVKK